jgi:hypothetical protein
METKDKLVKQLNKLRLDELYSRLLRIFLLTIFIILIPILIYDKFIEKDTLTALVLLLAELLFIGIDIALYKGATEFFNLKSSRIYQCLENTEAVTEIVVTPFKIVFEIKGMEDETIFLKPSEFRTEFINNITKVFGENKIANITNN